MPDIILSPAGLAEAQRYAHLQVDEIRDALDGLFGTE